MYGHLLLIPAIASTIFNATKLRDRSFIMRKLVIISVAFLLVLGSVVNAESADASISITIENNDVDWCNLQHPGTGSFETGNVFITYAQVYEAGVTDAVGQGADIYAWIGYSESDTDPSGEGWTWVAASFNADVNEDSNDEYIVDLGNEISSAGTYYVASRFSRDNVNYKYGGYVSGAGGFWDGSTNVSAVYTVTVNTAPVLASIGNQGLTEDVAAIVELSASDAESNSITYSVEGGSSSTVLAVVSNDTLYLTPADDYFTAEAISLTITADDGHGGSDSETFEVTVTNVNDAPTIAVISDQTGSEGTELTFDLTGSDADADELTWTSDNLPTGAVFTDNTDGTATFTWTPTYTQAGTYSDVQFIVNDNQGGQALMRMKTRR